MSDSRNHVDDEEPEAVRLRPVREDDCDLLVAIAARSPSEHAPRGAAAMGRAVRRAMSGRAPTAQAWLIEWKCYVPVGRGSSGWVERFVPVGAIGITEGPSDSSVWLAGTAERLSVRAAVHTELRRVSTPGRPAQRTRRGSQFRPRHSTASVAAIRWIDEPA